MTPPWPRRGLLWHFKGLRNRAARKVWTTLPQWMVRLAVQNARLKLKKLGPVQVLVDVTVQYHAVTHETAWVSLGPVEGYSARIPVHRPDTHTVEFQNIKYLAGIAHLARIGAIELLTSAELLDEQFRQPGGRYRGYSYFDHSLFVGLTLNSVDGHVFPTMGPQYFKLPSAEEKQRARLREHERTFPQYKELVKCLGRKNSNDTWHLFTAERHGLFCYLTMDFRFIRTMEAQARTQAVRSLRTLVLTPAQFAKRFGIFPVPPHFLSYEDADCFVHPELSMPDNKRRPRNKYRSPSGG